MKTSSAWLPGMQFIGRYFVEIVEPLVAQHFPTLDLAAARLDYGSEVLGFDTETSLDHDWGLKFQLFLAPEDLDHAEPIRKMLDQNLPKDFFGFPTRFTAPGPDGTRQPAWENGEQQTADGASGGKHHPFDLSAETGVRAL